MEVGNLLLEVQSDRAIILSEDFNTISIGFRYTPKHISFVLVFTSKLVGISRIAPVDFSSCRSRLETCRASRLRAQ
jgi:hypothetical protein